MMTSRAKKGGFTIVELLIVIVVIGILAAVTIVAYNGIQNRANDATVEADLATIAKKLELARVDLGRYSSNSLSEFPTDFKFSKAAYKADANNAMFCTRSDTSEYALGVTSKSGRGYILTQSGVQKGVSATHAAACAAIGTTWTNTPPTTVIHGFNPIGTTGYTNGWNNGWVWTSY